MVWRTRCIAGASLALAGLGAWACSETTKPPPSVASVVVTSPIGARLAVGRTAQLSVTARDGSGAEMTGVSFTWATSAPGVATVSGTGLVTGVAEGTATITARAQGIDGTFAHQVIAADLAAARATLRDAFATALVGGLTSTLRTQVQAALTQCETGMDSGNFDTMDAAMDATRTGISGASDPTDKALTASFALFVDQAYRLLRL